MEGIEAEGFYITMPSLKLSSYRTTQTGTSLRLKKYTSNFSFTRPPKRLLNDSKTTVVTLPFQTTKLSSFAYIEIPRSSIWAPFAGNTTREHAHETAASPLQYTATTQICIYRICLLQTTTQNFNSPTSLMSKERSPLSPVVVLVLA